MLNIVGCAYDQDGLVAFDGNNFTIWLARYVRIEVRLSRPDLKRLSCRHTSASAKQQESMREPKFPGGVCFSPGKLSGRGYTRCCCWHVMLNDAVYDTDAELCMQQHMQAFTKDMMGG